MKLLVTGGCGFIGTNFILDQIHNHNNKILNLDILSYAGNTENLHDISNNINYKFVQGDICDINIVKKLIFEYKPDGIIHFAAQSHVDRSIDSPNEFIKTNVIGTTILLQSALEYYNKTKSENFRFLHISTDEVYGSINNNDSFTEKSPYRPNSPYSASKASSDHFVRSWHQTYDLPTIITNCSNNYGPFQFPEKLIPLIIANCIDEKSLPIYGDGLNIRDWLFVNDHCDALYKVLLEGSIGETYNIGGKNELTNIDVVKTICNILDEIRPRKDNLTYFELIKFVKDRPGHDYKYSIDTTKILKDIGWKPNERFQIGIRKTIQWYLENEDWWRNIQKNNYSQERLGLKENKNNL